MPPPPPQHTLCTLAERLKMWTIPKHSKLDILPQAEVRMPGFLKSQTLVCVHVRLQVINYYTKFLYTHLPLILPMNMALLTKYIVNSYQKRAVLAIHLTINAIYAPSISTIHSIYFIPVKLIIMW